MVDVKLVSDELELSFATANKLVEQLERLRLVREITGRKRARVFRFQPYLDLFEDEEGRPPEGELQETAYDAELLETAE